VLQLNLGSGLTNQRVTQLVRCQTQARLLRHLLPLLTPAEQQVCRRGVNMKPLSPPRHASIRDYRQATGFECLVGYWHLSDRWNRFEALMAEDVLQEEFLRALQGGTLQQAILQR
jgi:ribonuclease-3 family protein